MYQPSAVLVCTFLFLCKFITVQLAHDLGRPRGCGYSLKIQPKGQGGGLAVQTGTPHGLLSATSIAFRAVVDVEHHGPASSMVNTLPSRMEFEIHGRVQVSRVGSDAQLPGVKSPP